MERRPVRIGALLVGLIVSMLLGGLASPARAGLVIASDPYLIGSGGYVAGTSLLKQPSVAATGFVSGSTYSAGSLTNNFSVQAGGLAATDPANAGHVSYDGVGSDTATSSGTYWFSINVSQDGSSLPIAGSPTGYALAGYGNTTPPVLGATTTTGLPSGSPAFLQGLFFGFAHEANDPASSNGDLVIRYRNTIGDTSGDAILVAGAAANKTYSIIAKLDVNGTGGTGGSVDNLTYWLNPTNTSSEAAMDASTSVTNFANPLATFAFQIPADFFRLTYSAQSWNGDGGSASFGDPTLGLTLADVVPAVAVPEPSSIAMMAMGMVGGLGLAVRRRRALA
jgi:hypothetical protein